MKYPALITYQEACAQPHFDTIIDVRSPSEFALDHIPGAVNLAVLDDQQRVQIGTLYKQTGAFEAKRLGAALIARNIAQHLEFSLHDKPRSWRPLVYCWRGGNRSGAMAHILAKVGWPVAQLDSGYKAYRHAVLTQLAEKFTQFRWVCLLGPTGSGKSRLLQTLAHRGEQVLDLEQLANHRGSLLGHLPSLQPSQKYFESQLLAKLAQFSVERPVYIESESKKIGNLRLPDALILAMRQATCVRIELSRQQRVQLLIDDYQHLLSDRQSLLARLSHFQQLVGNKTVEFWQALLEQNRIAELVDALLELHYDLAYQRSLRANYHDYPVLSTITMSNFDADTLAQAASELVTQVSLSSMMLRP